MRSLFVLCILCLLLLCRSQIFLTATWEEAQFDGENSAHFFQMNPTQSQALYLNSISPYFINAANNSDVLLGIDHMFQSDDGQIHLTLLGEYSNVGKVPARLIQDRQGRIDVVHPNDDDEFIREISTFSKDHQFGMRFDGYDFVVQIGNSAEKIISKISDMFYYPSVEQIDYQIVDSEKGVRVWYLGNDAMLYYHGNNFKGKLAPVFRMYEGVETDFANMSMREWNWTGDLDEVEDTVSSFSQYNDNWYAGMITGAFEGYKICQVSFDWENHTIDFTEIARHEGNLTINGTIAPSYLGLRAMTVVQCVSEDDCLINGSEENCGESFTCANFNCFSNNDGVDCTELGESCVVVEDKYLCEDKSATDETDIESNTDENEVVTESSSEDSESSVEHTASLCLSMITTFIFF